MIYIREFIIAREILGMKLLQEQSSISFKFIYKSMSLISTESCYWRLNFLVTKITWHISLSYYTIFTQCGSNPRAHISDHRVIFIRDSMIQFESNVNFTHTMFAVVLITFLVIKDSNIIIPVDAEFCKIFYGIAVSKSFLIFREN